MVRIERLNHCDVGDCAVACLVVVHIHQLDELVTGVRRWAKRAWLWAAEDALRPMHTERD